MNMIIRLGLSVAMLGLLLGVPGWLMDRFCEDPIVPSDGSCLDRANEARAEALRDARKMLVIVPIGLVIILAGLLWNLVHWAT